MRVIPAERAAREPEPRIRIAEERHSGSGMLDESIVLPAGGSAAFAISAHAPVFDGVPLVASAQATLSGGIVDSQPGDNQAADVDAGPAGIFTDGFDGH